MTATPAAFARDLRAAKRLAMGKAWRASFSPPGKSMSLMTSIKSRAMRDLRCFPPCRLNRSAIATSGSFLEETLDGMFGPLFQAEMLFLAEVVAVLDIAPIADAKHLFEFRHLDCFS